MHHSFKRKSRAKTIILKGYKDTFTFPSIYNIFKNNKCLAMNSCVHLQINLSMCEASHLKVQKEKKYVKELNF